jgi:hypothetical protein
MARYVSQIQAPLSVQMFSADGTPLPSLSVTSVGLSEQTRAAAYVNSSNTLILAGHNGDASNLVAVVMTSRVVRWTTAPGMLNDAFAIAVLPQQGVAFVVSRVGATIHAYRLSDGMRVTSVKIDGCTFLASDPATATV